MDYLQVFQLNSDTKRQFYHQGESFFVKYHEEKMKDTIWKLL